ncbi:tRNA (guanine(9)-N(1))-methyltransferase [Microbotryomycetes sp. JL201]|nr:tRNA (guanine(9)-N(1))-methyltransferase [Microbotryomycetes sp. JL201]
MAADASANVQASTSSPVASTSTVTLNLQAIADDQQPLDQTQPMSKNALKRLAKKQKFEAIKQERRLKERNKRKERQATKRKLIEQGIDVEADVDDEQRAASAAKKLKKTLPKQPFGARIVIDCAFDDLMNDKEVKSMSSQLGFCYAANRSTTRPFDLMVTSLNGRLKSRFDSLQDKAHEAWRNVEWWTDGYEHLWQHELSTHGNATSGEDANQPGSTFNSMSFVEIGVKKGQRRSQCPKDSVVYLTGDSPNVLSSLEAGKTYVLGGIVDRNRYKKLCLDKADRQGISHAQLPIGQYLPDLPTRKVLTVNQVFEIMVKWAETEDWAEALKSVMPERKLTEGKGRKKNDCENLEQNIAESGSAGTDDMPDEGHLQISNTEQTDAVLAQDSATDHTDKSAVQ